MFKKGAFTFILTALIILGLTATSFANPGKGNTGWKFNGKGNGKVVQFNDIGSHWAAQTIREMNRLGITSGYPDYSFKPNAPVSRYEAMMMICRAMDDFEQEDGLSWEGRLEECLNYAEENDIIDDAEDFEGWKPAKRYEVAVWAMKAAGDLDVDDETLPFLDINDIPEDARHYIGVMFNHKWMVGYPDKKFQPNKPVTRAELTVIIYRILGDVWPDNGDNDGSGLRIAKIDPNDGESGVDPDTDKLTVRFNMDIVAVVDDLDVEEGIEIENLTDTNEDAAIDSVSFNGRVLTIELEEGTLDEDMKYRVTIDDGIIESENGEEEFDGISSSEWEFSTFDEDEDGPELDSLNPENDEKNVEPTATLEAKFKSDIEVISDKDIDNAVEVKKDDQEVEIENVKIEDGDTLVITLKDELESGETFEVTIMPGFIEDVETLIDYDGLDGDEWRFTTG
jgi:hypothetical protein